MMGDTCSDPILRFVDNGDGTVTDRRTCLVWEQKTGDMTVNIVCPDAITCPDPHAGYNLSNVWYGLPAPPDGTAYTIFLPQLNSGHFVGHSDWRLPEVWGQTGLGAPDRKARRVGEPPDVYGSI